MHIGDGLKKVLLAGVGAVALTGEKTGEILDTLVEKGELTVEQGKALNEELKHTVRETVKESKKAETENVKADEGTDSTAGTQRNEVREILENMSDEQIAQLKALLDGLNVTPVEPEEEKE